MEYYGRHFEFGEVSSRIYSLIFASVDTSENLSLYGERTGTTVFNKKSRKRHLVSEDFSSSPISFEVEIVTENCDGIEESRIREIEKWLFKSKSYRRLYVDLADDDEGKTYEYIDGQMKRFYLNCRLINPSKIETGAGVVGFRATLEADSDMFWQEEIVKTFDEIPNSGIVEFEIDTDKEDYTYPEVTLQIGNAGGDVAIFNSQDSTTRLTKFTGLTGGISLIMKGETNYVSDDNYMKFTSPNFIRLVDGVNYICIQGNVDSIAFKWQNRRFL